MTEQETRRAALLTERIIERLNALGELDEGLLTTYFEVLERELDAGNRDSTFRNARAQIGRIESSCARAGYFTTADDLFRRRMEITRKYQRELFAEERTLSTAIRRIGFFLWLYTSHYGTSITRLVWLSGNVMLWFSVVYFLLDTSLWYIRGVPAFAHGVIHSPLSYLLLGVQGFFPGSAFNLGSSFAAQLVLTIENILGAFLLLSAVTVIARRVWRGAG